MLFPAEHAAPPKKPPRPGAQSQVGSLACLNTGDSYNDGVKVHTHTHTQRKETKITFTQACIEKH